MKKFIEIFKYGYEYDRKGFWFVIAEIIICITCFVFITYIIKNL